MGYLFLIFLLVGVIGGYVFYEKYGKQILACRDEALELVKDVSEETFRRDETSIIYDAKGKKLREVTGEKEVYYKTYDEIPAYFVEAMVSVEDRRFYEHNGVDYEGNFSLDVRVNPLITLVWIGFGMLLAGTLFALAGRRRTA